MLTAQSAKNTSVVILKPFSAIEKNVYEIITKLKENNVNLFCYKFSQFLECNNCINIKPGVHAKKITQIIC